MSCPDLIETTGTLEYSESDVGPKLIVNVDQEIVSFARSLVPKYLKLNPQRYPAHISVIRHEVPTLMEHWNKHQGKNVSFLYSPCVQNGQVYYWLDAYSEELKAIRQELGLTVSSHLTRPPNGKECYHITIGNVKKLI